MRIFLDTDALSYFFSGNMNMNKKIVESIESGDSICLTSINVYEILKGLKYKNSAKKERDFKKFLNEITVYSFDEDAIQMASDIYAQLRKEGISIGDADILIAGIVISNQGKLITNNTRHYQRIQGLTIENWNQP